MFILTASVYYGMLNYRYTVFVSELSTQLLCNFVEYTLSGLRVLTNFTICVSVHNGVSDQDPSGEEQRRCEVNGTTGDIS